MKAITISASLIYFLATTSAVSAYHPQPPNFRIGTVHRRDANDNMRRIVKRTEFPQFEKRAPLPQISIDPNPTEDEGAQTTTDPPGSTPTESTTNPGNGGGGGPSSSTTPPAPPPQQTTTSSSSTPVSTPTTEERTPTTSNQPSPSSTITTTINTSVTTTGTGGTTLRNTNVASSYNPTRTAAQGSLTLRVSQTASSETSEPTSGSTPFMQNKGAVAATAVVVSLVAVGALVFVGFWLKKKNQRGKMGDDTWDEASMKEFPPAMGGAGAGGSGIVPPPLMTSSGGLGRSNTVLPSQSAGALPLARTKSHSARSHEDDGYGAHSDEPDELLAMPPVSNYERPRDSAFDIVPPPPPPAMTSNGSSSGHGGSSTGYSPTAFSPGGYNNYNGYGNAYASTSAAAAAAAAGLEPPKRKGDHTSYGSGVGHDPFAGTGFVDATRESSYGSGQAGRGAGYSGANNAAYGGQYGSDDDHSAAYDGNAVAGPSRSNYQTQPNQWGQAYNPYQGYGQASGSGGYGQASGSGGYGGYGYAN